MKYILSILIISNLLFSCQDSSHNDKIDIADSTINLLDSSTINDTSNVSEPSVDETSYKELVDSFYVYYENTSYKPQDVDCNQPFNPKPILNTDLLLSYLQCTNSRAKQTLILRQVLIASKYKYTRTQDSLRYIKDNDLLKMIAIVYNQEVYSEVLEGNDSNFNSYIQKIQGLLKKKESNDIIFKFIHDSVFNFIWLDFTIQKVTEDILQLDFNGGGMAGSAEKRYFLQTKDSLQLIDLDKIATKIDAAMTREIGENARANMYRFPIKFKRDPGSDILEIQLIIDTYSSASCCPPYVARFKSKDFRTIIPGTLSYATTDHLDNPSIKPKWKVIK